MTYSITVVVLVLPSQLLLQISRGQVMLRVHPEVRPPGYNVFKTAFQKMQK
jgi:hypothetical protein